MEQKIVSRSKMDLLCRGWKPDVNVQSAVLGYESEVHEPSLESRQVLMYLVDRGRVVGKNS